jgi:hypothetical protein
VPALNPFKGLRGIDGGLRYGVESDKFKAFLKRFVDTTDPKYTKDAKLTVAPSEDDFRLVSAYKSNMEDYLTTISTRIRQLSEEDRMAYIDYPNTTKAAVAMSRRGGRKTRKSKKITRKRK